MTISTLSGAILNDVQAELDRQDAKWGPQSHPDGTGGRGYVIMANSAKSQNDAAVEAGTLTWAGILYEEFWEALAESDQTLLREELIQVAAVAVQWVKAIDLRSRPATKPVPDLLGMLAASFRDQRLVAAPQRIGGVA